MTIEDDEAGVHSDALSADRHWDGVGMATDPICAFVDRHIMALA